MSRKVCKDLTHGTEDIKYYCVQKGPNIETYLSAFAANIL